MAAVTLETGHELNVDEVGNPQSACRGLDPPADRVVLHQVDDGVDPAVDGVAGEDLSRRASPFEVSSSSNAIRFPAGDTSIRSG